MIKQLTTLVLGAGASKPYGFPTGVELRDKILGITNEGDGTATERLFQELGFSLEQYRRFHTAFLGSGVQSIDAFLETQPQFLGLGKTAMAMALIPFERLPGVLFPVPSAGPWYDLLIRAMWPPAKFEENKLRVVTFNYDRSLEVALHQHVKYTRAAPTMEQGLSDKAAAEIVQAIPIVHIYGQLAPLPWQGGESVRSYEPEVTGLKIAAACSNIRLITERDAEEAAAKNENVALAQEYVRTAERVYFVGFSYDETNMKRLSLVKDSKNPRWIYGTGCGMGEAQRIKVSRQWPVHLHDATARQFFTEHFVLE